MPSNSYEETCRAILEPADIKINGTRPWDIQVYDDRFYKRVLSEGSLGFAESYMDGLWDSDSIDGVVKRTIDSINHGRFDGLKLLLKNPRIIWPVIKSRLLNMQTIGRSRKVVDEHYDIGNDLFEITLGEETMSYTCGYDWKNSKNLDQAQKNKMKLVSRKLGLEGHNVLELGCGWGNLAKFMAEERDCNVTGISISDEQIRYAQERNFHQKVKILNRDYRNIEGKYDRVVALGLYEHVGRKNHRKLMEVAHKSLKDDGLFLIQTIGTNSSKRHAYPFIRKYIFPNGEIPTANQITNASKDLFVIEDWHNFGFEYDPTLMAWNDNFQRNWIDLKDSGKYDERFKRMWEYYLLSSAATFRARHLQLWQIVLSKGGVKGGYESVR